MLRDEIRTPGLYLIQLDDQGERTFLYWRNQSAARYLLQHPNFGMVKQALTRVDAVFLSGISLAILLEEDRISLLNLLVELKAQGVEIAFDSNFRPALWPQDDNQTVKNVYQAMYQLTDVALVTFDDEQLIWGDETPEQTIERLTSLGVGKCIVKLGADGCLVQDSTNQVRARLSLHKPCQPNLSLKWWTPHRRATHSMVVFIGIPCWRRSRDFMSKR